MRYSDIVQFVLRAGPAVGKGPLAIVMAEDEVELDSTLRHLLKLGFHAVVMLAPEGVTVADEVADQVHIVTHDVFAEAALPQAVNRFNDAFPGIWIHYCYNAEYLFYPFCETRSIREVLTFHTEERRAAMMTYVIDLYAGDLTEAPNAVSIQDVWLDGLGYYALARKDPARNWEPKERQMDFFGGLRWRFEEHVPWARRKIDRISLFRARPGLRLAPTFTFNDEEMNTFACPWHNNLTAAVCSFRTAKALRTNPGSRDAISGFRWHKSLRFDWHSQQLLNLGLIEPGQWF